MYLRAEHEYHVLISHSSLLACASVAAGYATMSALYKFETRLKILTKTCPAELSTNFAKYKAIFKYF